MQYSVVNYRKTLEHMDFRIDPDFFKPEYSELEKTLANYNSKSFGSMTKQVRCGPFGSTILCDTYLTDGVIVARPFNLKNFSLERDNLVFINEEDCINKNLKFYQEGDILFSRVGDVRCGIIPNFDSKITISPNIIGVKIDRNKINPYYATLFFNSRYGFPQILRELKVVAQPTIPTTLIKELQIIQLGDTSVPLKF